MLNDVDKKIIIELQKDGRKSFSDLSKKFDISISTLRRRVNKMIEDGVITITAVPDPEKIGYSIMALIVYNINRKSLQKTVNQICSFKYNHLVGMTSGRWDVASWSLFKNNDELKDYLINDIAAMDGMISTETLLVLKYAKRTFGWLHE